MELLPAANVPVQVSNLTGVTAIAAGQTHAHGPQVGWDSMDLGRTIPMVAW